MSEPEGLEGGPEASARAEREPAGSAGGERGVL